MKIHKNTHNRIMAEISKSDLDSYELDFESIDYNGVGTRLMLYDILKSVRLKLSENSSVEVLPDVDGGIIVLISAAYTGRYKINKNCFVCALPDIDCAFSVAKALRGKASAKLFYDEHTYRVLASPEPGQKLIDKILSEFGETKKADYLTMARLEEYCTVICNDITKTLSA